MKDGRKILVIGSGPIRIGQGIEFDYCSVHAAKAIKKKGYEAVVINNNPETVSTDYSVADRLYFEPLAVEDVLRVIEKEKVEGVLIQFGGQTAINIAHALEEEGVRILGTSVADVDKLEDRKEFYQLLEELAIPHINGEIANHSEELLAAAAKLGYPVLVRPSYVIGGQSMFTIYTEEELKRYIEKLAENSQDQMWPLLVDRYMPGLECEIDVISDGQEIIVPGIFEHIERAGVHSGDSITVFPPVSLSSEMKEILVDYARRIATSLPIVGIMNIQFVIYDNTVYVLEVNPRSSRTVPIISKVTGTPMIEWAIRVQLGEQIKDFCSTPGLLLEPHYYAVKSPVFSSGKLKGVDPVLGPEMKSTGEILGLGITLKEALQKALPFTHELKNDENYILCSISDRAKEESLPILKELACHQFKFAATAGTAQFLQKNGIIAEEIIKDSDQLNKLYRSQKISAVINIPSEGRNDSKFGFYIREQSVKFNVPCYTHFDTVKTIIGLKKQNHLETSVNTVGEYFKIEESPIGGAI